MSQDLILQTTGLTKEFKGFAAVQNVDLKVKRGNIHALIGPNGAGKTTVFNLLTKFLQPTAGKIEFNGIDITREESAQIARRGVVRSFQISATFPNLSVMELEPELMLLDEPTQGMGHEDVDRVVELIRKVSQGRTILMVEHNLSVVESLCNVITVLQRGAILAEGPYDVVSKDPRVLEASVGVEAGAQE